MSCQSDLPDGWHADHVEPWSKGGSTDVINGQALCPPCNLKKGNRTMHMRDWQKRALSEFSAHDKDFLVVATPGAGKTRFALAAARNMMDAGIIDRIIVVVPTSHLRRQWAHAAVKHYGIDLDINFKNGAALSSDYDGTAVTYATVANQPLFWRTTSTARPTLVIFDEIHHAGDAEHLSWGPALKEAFEPCRRRILLSGTPFRSDRQAIPFVEYDTNGECIPGFDYSYGRALQDEGVVRPIEFLAWDGEVRWLNAGAVQPPVHLSDATDEDLASALRSALLPSSDWIKSVLKKADEELTRHRQVMPDAGGLVVASMQNEARQYADILHSITGERPTLAVSDEADSSGSIERFANSSDRWIVAVKMVSEGVDIPRLTCGVYATNVRTEMFVRQVVGRFVRKRNDDDDVSAALFIPSIEPLLRIATSIEHTITEALVQDMERAQREAKEGPQQKSLVLVEPLPGGDASLHSTIRSGESYTEEELARAMDAAAAAGLGHLSAAQAAAFARAVGGGKVVGTTTIETEPSPTLKSDENKAQRRVIQRLVGQLSRLNGVEHKHIHLQLNQLCGSRIDEATSEELQQRIQLLDGWIRGNR